MNDIINNCSQSVLKDEQCSACFAIAERVVNALIKHGLHISFAESCTGGLCAKALTDLAGASEVIEASVVSYSNRIKIEKLGVKAETIEKHTEVSAECALEMARGAKKFATAEVGAALTGYAGPSGKDVGLVFVAVSSPFGEKVEELRLRGSREEIRLTAANRCFDLVLRILK